MEPAVRLRVFLNSDSPDWLRCWLSVTKSAFGHVDFTAYLERLGDFVSQKSLRQATKRSNVVRDIVPNVTVPTRDRLHEQAIVVTDRGGHTIHFEFDHPLDRFARQELFGSRKKVSKLLF